MPCKAFDKTWPACFLSFHTNEQGEPTPTQFRLISVGYHLKLHVARAF